MEFELKHLCLASGALAGTLRVAYGWWESDKPFDKRQFGLAMIRTMIQAAMLGYAANQDPIAVFFEVYTTDTLLTKSVPATRGEK